MNAATVLIVDDEQFPTAHYVRRLEDAGHTVVHCISTDDALTYLADASDLDVVVLDMMMPPGEHFRFVETESGLRTGALLAQEIRKMGRAVPIIALSNISRAQLQLDASVFDLVLEKLDVTPSELVEIVRRVVDGDG